MNKRVLSRNEQNGLKPRDEDFSVYIVRGEQGGREVGVVLSLLPTAHSLKASFLRP